MAKSSDPCEIGRVPPGNGVISGRRLGSSGAMVADGWVFGLDWGKIKKETETSLQKYMRLTTGRGDKDWEYYYRKEDAVNDAKAMKRSGYTSKVYKCHNSR